MMDDILVHGKTHEEHDSRLQEVLRRIQHFGLTLNKEKCCFSLPEVKFLGQVIDSEGIRLDPDKVSAIRQVLNQQTWEMFVRFSAWSIS